MEDSIPNTSPISSSVLKWMAILTMTIDHIGAVLIEPMLYNSSGSSIATGIDWQFIYTSCRLVGRLAFPIYCFLIVEGYIHTRSVPKYASRLGLFALISEIPFDLAFSGQMFDWATQNVFFTLLLGLFAIWAYDTLDQPILRIGLPMALALFAQLLNTDYQIYGVGFILILFITRPNRLKQTLIGALYGLSQMTASLSFIPIYFYNGKKGRGNSKWLYWFYPVHLLILAGMAYLIFNTSFLL